MKKIIVLTLVIASLFSFIAVLSAQEAETGTISGSVFQDTNGDGLCQDKVPLSGVSVDLELSSTNTKARAVSNKDGTYSVPSAAQGGWSATVFAVNRSWGAVSTNPIQFELSALAGTDTDIDFCMQRATNNGNVITNTGIRVPLPPAPIAESLPQSNKSLSEQSADLLIDPPDPIQPKEAHLVRIQKEDLQEKAIPVEDWLDYMNAFREIAGVAPVTEDSDLSFGAHSHSRYMVVHDLPISHSEDPKYALYSEAGNTAGVNSLIFSTSQIRANHVWAFNFFASAPFHLVGLIDPNLKTTGYGHYNENVGTFKMAGVLDVQSGLQSPLDEGIEYPIQFPADGQETWVVRHSLYEWPNSIPSCPGFSRPTGSPIVLMLGDGDSSPTVTEATVLQNGTPLDICVFHEANFTNPDPVQQATGRTVLGQHNTIVLMPRKPLRGGADFFVKIQANGKRYSWNFTTRTKPKKIDSK